MRLLIATPLYPPEPGGPATYAHILENELPKRGVEIGMLPFGHVRKYPKIIRHIAYTLLVMRALKDADAVFALDPVSTGLPALLASFVTRKPLFVKVVGDYAWEQGVQRFGVRVALDEFVGTRHVPPMVMLLRQVQTLVARHARTVIVPSEYLKGIVTRWGIAPEHITVVHNAQPERIPGDLPEEVAQASRPLVVTAGRLVPWKGMPGVIAALAQVKSEFPDATLVIAGDGPDRESLETYAEARLPENTLFLGALPHAETLAVIEASDVFVLNSTYEGLSHLLIEALSLGRPVIATDVGGNPELVEDGVNGLLVPPNDPQTLGEAIGHLLRTPAHREQLGARAQATREKFSVSRMIEGTLAVIKG